MASSDSNRLPFGNAPKDDEPMPLIPPLPDFQVLVMRIRRQADKAKTIEARAGFIDVGIEELKQIKAEGWRQYHELVAQNRLDDPDPFWSYDSDIDKAISELEILRRRLILEEADRSAPAPARRDEVAQSASVFAAASASPISAADPQAAPPEVMDIKQLAVYLKVSESWLYKNYESEGIPHFWLGTSLRFRKDEIDERLRAKGKAGSDATSSPEAEESHTHHATPKRREDKERSKATPVPDDEDTAVDLSKLPEPNQRIVSIVDKLIPMLCNKVLLHVSEAAKLREWLLYNAPDRRSQDRVRWPNDDRRSLATFIVLCQHADIIHLPTNPKRSSPRYSVALRDGFRLASGSITQEIVESIDRSHLAPLEKHVSNFEAILADMVRTDIDPGRPWPHQLFCSLQTYFGEIDGSPDYKAQAKKLEGVCKAIDMSLMRIFFDVSVELPELFS